MSTAQRFGKYTLLRKIATGGMAEVFLARSEGAAGFQKLLVIKRILPNLAKDQQFVSMFLNEARVASQLNHPNIVSIYELGEAEGAYYIAMEHIDGPNLRALCRRGADGGHLIPPALAVKMISLAAEGLHYAHDAVGFDGQPLGLIHRDISPDNILLSRQGSVKVVDFGIVKAANQPHLTNSGILKGKLAYMPPEQLQEQAVDRRADVFSLGICLYELLAGARPFDSPNEVALLQAILHASPPPLRSLRPEVDAELEAVVMRSLQKDRDQRYPTCQAFQLDLEKYLMARGMAPGARDLASLVDPLLGPPASLQLTPLPASQPPRPISNPALHEAGEISLSGRQRDPRAPLPPPVNLTNRKATPSHGPQVGAISAVLGGLGALLAVGAVGFGAYALGHRSAPVFSPSAPGSTLRLAPPVAWVPPPAPAPPTPTPAPAAVVPPPAVAAVIPPAEAKEPAAQDAHHPIEARRHPRHADSALVATAASPPSTVPAPPMTQVGQLEFRVLPWANVEIDHRPFGQTPLAPVSLDAGSHHVVLTNNELHARQELDITIQAGQTYVVKQRMGEP